MAGGSIGLYDPRLIRVDMPTWKVRGIICRICEVSIMRVSKNQGS